MKIYMTNLCSDIKWKIYTFLNGNPVDNYKLVIEDLETYWFDYRFYNEITCYYPNCNNICLKKEASEIIIGDRTLGYYCSDNCALQDSYYY